MTVVYRITGDGIGPDGNGAAHFEKQSEANKALREYRKTKGKDAGSGPEQLKISGRDELVAALDEAMGFGVSYDTEK